jgi:hypothetical protein
MTVGNTIPCGLISFDGFLVCLEVEVDEKAKVACEKATSQQSSSFSTGAIRPMGKVRVVSGRVMLVGCGPD